MSFDTLGLSADLLQTVAEEGYTAPTPVQAAAIPLVLEGRDVLAAAQTGTGKTAAFGVPIAHHIREDLAEPQVLILAPTRELASQIADELARLTAYLDIRIASIYGGAAMGPQLSALASGSHIVVGTPGRILDHLNRGTMRLDTVAPAVREAHDARHELVAHAHLGVDGADAAPHAHHLAVDDAEAVGVLGIDPEPAVAIT